MHPFCFPHTGICHWLMIRDEYEKEQCFITSYSEMEEDIDISRPKAGDGHWPVPSRVSEGSTQASLELVKDLRG